MKKDLLIGAVDLYGWDKIATWVKTMRATGYADDIVLLAYRLKDPDVILAECQKYNVQVYEIDYDAFGKDINHNDRGRDTQAHQLRFFHLWQFLKNNKDIYRNVLITDVRDVLFQSNPFPTIASTDKILASSESIKYFSEVWGAENMMNGFGPFVWQHAIMWWTVYNVGVVAGPAEKIERLAFLIYNMTLGRYIPCDQSIYNALVNDVMPEAFELFTHDKPYACQCGVTLDPEKSYYKPHLLDSIPVMRDGLVYTAGGELFSIVHQYDRVPELKKKYEN